MTLALRPGHRSQPLPFYGIRYDLGAANDLNPGWPACVAAVGQRPRRRYQFTSADSQNYILTVTPLGEYDTS